MLSCGPYNQARSVRTLVWSLGAAVWLQSGCSVAMHIFQSVWSTSSPKSLRSQAEEAHVVQEESKAAPPEALAVA